MVRCEHYFILILKAHAYLVVSKICIHEARELVFDNGVHKLVNPWEREGILWACLVDVCIVNTNPPFSILFLHHDYIG